VAPAVPDVFGDWSRREAHRFFEKLIAGGFATTDLAAAQAGRLQDLQCKAWYRLLGASRITGTERR
jgi:hypothetical protein